MTVLEQRRYRDPLEVLLADEAKTCKGCAHEQFYTAFDLAVWVCTAKDKNNKRRNHGKRCSQYGEK
jgi:hypothetical protein